MKREDIHIVAKYSQLTENGVSQALKTKVYNNREAWQQFFKLFFISLGVGFTVAGILFFFAYNWADLHKFTKIGLIEGLLIVTIFTAIVSKVNDTIKNIILTGGSVLVGVLFAVFGQIYQTGANAYDFFLVWTVFITLWVFISNFSPLWLLYLILINTTFLLYAQQVAQDWSEVFICSWLFIINAVTLIITLGLGKKRIPIWFSRIVSLAAVSYATVGIVMGIFEEFQTMFPVLIFSTAGAYALGIWQGLQSKSLFYLSVIPFSLIVILSALLVKISDGEVMFLLVSLFVVVSVTLTVKNLIDLQKKWTNEA